MNGTVTQPVLFCINRLCFARSVEHYHHTGFEAGETVWLNYSKRLRTGTTVANISKTYRHGQQVFRRDGETFSLPKDLLTETKNHER